MIVDWGIEPSELREYAEEHLYDGDSDQPCDGYDKLLEAADALEEARSELARYSQDCAKLWSEIDRLKHELKRTVVELAAERDQHAAHCAQSAAENFRLAVDLAIEAGKVALLETTNHIFVPPVEGQ